MKPRRPLRQEPMRCRCAHAVDTPEWNTAKRGRRAGLTGRGGAFHGNPFRGKKGCIHSDLFATTRPAPKPKTVKRIRLR